MPNPNKKVLAERISDIQKRIEKRSLIIADLDAGLAINQAFLRDVLDLEGLNFSTMVEDSSKAAIMKLLISRQDEDRKALNQFKISIENGNEAR